MVGAGSSGSRRTLGNKKLKEFLFCVTVCPNCSLSRWTMVDARGLALCAWLLATPDGVCGFGSLQYLNRPTTELTTYTGTPDPHMPLPFTFNNGELEINTDPTTHEVIVKQNVVPPPPASRPPSPLAPPPPTPFEHFTGGACTCACHKTCPAAERGRGGGAHAAAARGGRAWPPRAGPRAEAHVAARQARGPPRRKARAQRPPLTHLT